jgi:hypothetical protein
VLTGRLGDWDVFLVLGSSNLYRYVHISSAALLKSSSNAATWKRILAQLSVHHPKYYRADIAVKSKQHMFAASHEKHTWSFLLLGWDCSPLLLEIAQFLLLGSGAILEIGHFSRVKSSSLIK